MVGSQSLPRSFTIFSLAPPEEEELLPGEDGLFLEDGLVFWL